MGQAEHRSRCLDTPVGRLTLVEANGKMVRLAWTDHEAGDPLAVAGETALLERTAAQLTEYFANKRRDFDLPLAPEGTAFQRRVWIEMARIPYGATLSYGELARKVGSVPRAIGQACKTNPIPIIIPCHRVLGKGGKPGGYSGGTGLDTKFALLQLEGALAQEPDLFGESHARA